ncbi:MAG: esterase [Candidatus Hydrogenedentota bacterium]|nr:MAG: esterase [Candidatus Hydrogenedentota bacterium]
MISRIALSCMILLSSTAIAATPYEQHQDLVYGESHGAGLLMDVFVPTGKKNGLAIIDIASGAWNSDRGKIRDHKMAQMYDIFCGRGYTVFAIRPGSVSRFTGKDMLANVNQGIRFVKAHADEYGIDADRLGITGASAGGHLASLAAVTAIDGNPKDRDKSKRIGTGVKAVAVFFPPTHFLDWGDEGMPNFAQIGPLLFPGGIAGKSDEDVKKRAREISPALQVTGSTPPFLIWHGDADPLVPLQQSEVFIKVLQDAGSDATLKVKPGGAHPWMTIPEEVADIADWFDEKL